MGDKSPKAKDKAHEARHADKESEEGSRRRQGRTQGSAGLRRGQVAPSEPGSSARSELIALARVVRRRVVSGVLDCATHREVIAALTLP